MESDWGDLAGSVAAFAAQSTGIPGAEEGSRVVLALIGIEDEQALMLRRIRRDVELLRLGPFRSAQEQLRIASRKGSAHPDYEYHLREAESSLVQAFGQSASAEELSVITLNLGLVEVVRGDEREAQSRLRESYGYCVTASRELVAQANDYYVAGSLVLSLMPGFNVRAIAKARRAKDARIALEGYVPFVNTVARVGNVIQGAATQGGLRLRKLPPGFHGGLLHDHVFELEWTDPQY